MRTILVAATSLVCCLFVITCSVWWLSSPLAATEENSIVVAAGERSSDEQVSDFMTSKLTTLNSAMQAAANDDYKALQQAGEDLIQLSRQAAWKRMSDASYQQDTVDFVDNVEFLIRMAKDKDAQGIPAAYSAVATSCLECHRHARRAKVASTERSSELSQSVAGVR